MVIDLNDKIKIQAKITKTINDSWLNLIGSDP
jgi:hypothetical protein